MGIRRRLVGAVAAGVASTVMLAPLPARAVTAKADTVRVSMREFMFSPATIHVPAGGTVTWTYDESATDPAPNCESVFLQLPLPARCPGHSTTSATTADGKPLWNSGVHRASGFPFAVRFATPGTYAYYCIPHGGPHPNSPFTHMNGVVIVDAVAVAGAGSTRSGVAVSGSSATAGPGVTGSALVAGQSAVRARSLPALAKTGPSGPMGWAAEAAALATGLGLALAMARRRLSARRG